MSSSTIAAASAARDARGCSVRISARPAQRQQDGPSHCRRRGANIASTMLRSTIVWTVEFCARHARLVALAAAVLAVVSSVYTVRHFAITTDASKLIATANGPGQQTSQQAFPEDKILVVVQAPTPELVDQATDQLAKALPGRAELFRSISQTGGGEFFQRNGLLFLPAQDVERTMGELTMAKPMLGVLASDPSLRGIADTLSFAVAGARQGQLKLDDLTRPLTLGADTLDDVLAGRPASFSWRVLVQGRPATPQELRRFIEIQPILNFAALEPGAAATAAIRQAASDLKLASDLHAAVRLTGQVPIDDEEFAIVREHAFVDIAATILAVLVILWLALRSLQNRPCRRFCSGRGPFRDSRVRSADGWLVQSDFDRLCGAVHRARRRLRAAVQRPISI